MSEIRQTNFRIDQASADAFRAFCEEKGWNQAQGFDHLLQVLELDQAKAEIPGRATEISDFEAHIKTILAIYIQSVALAENTQERIRGEFARKLESKDELIEKLQDELKAAKAGSAEAAEIKLQMFAMQGDYAQAQADLATLQDRAAYLQGQLEQIEEGKIAMERLLTERLQAAEARAGEVEVIREDRDRVAAELAVAQSAARDAAREHEIQIERAAVAAERAQAAAVAEERAKGVAAVSKLQAELQETQIGAERSLRSAEKEAAAEIRALEQQIADLKQQVARLENLKKE